VSCDRHGDHEFTSVDVEKHVGGQLTEHGHTNIDLTTPDNTVYVYVEDNAYHIGLDVAGKDLSKRQYKVFSSNEGINATLGYAFLQHCDISSESRVVNPFSRDGVIPIETALRHKGVSVNHYDREFKFDSLNILDFFDMDDKLDMIDKNLTRDNTDIHCYDRDFRNLKAQKKNAKIAGVEDHITFSRFEPEYIDLKFDDFQVDLIYGRPKTPSRQFPEEKLRNVYHDLFRYGKYVLKQSGKMIFLVKDDELLLDMANQFTLKETNRTTIRYRHIEYEAITLEREHPNALEATHL
jgi:23S rRNA G2445 N2-methylase RlmL